jgi:anti-sigma B factor antagonist
MDGPAPLTISVAGDATAPVISVDGELDLSNVDRLGAAISESIQADTNNVTLDVSGLRFMDSSGIALLVRTQARVGSLTLRQPSAIIRRLVEATGLADILRLEP